MFDRILAARLPFFNRNSFPSEPRLCIEPGAHRAGMTGSAVDAAGRWLVTSSFDNTVRVWRLTGPEAGTLERTLRTPIGLGNRDKVYAVALSPEGETVAIARAPSAGDPAIYLFDRAAGALRQGLGYGFSKKINYLVFDRTGRRLAVALGEGGVRIFGACGRGKAGPGTYWTGIGRYRVRGIDNRWADFAADGRFVTTSYDGKVRLYAPRRVWPGRTLWDGLWSALGGYMWCASVRPPSESKRLHGIAWSPNNERIAVGYRDKPAVDLLDARTLKYLGSANTAGIASGTKLGAVAWSADGRTLYAGTVNDEDDLYGVFQWSNGGLGSRDRILCNVTASIVGLHALPDGGLVIVSEDEISVFGPFEPGDEPERCWHRSLASADFRGQIHQNGIRVSASGSRVAFGLERADHRPALLDLGGPAPALTLDPAPGALRDLILPHEGPVSKNPARPDGPQWELTRWECGDEFAPWLNGAEAEIGYIGAPFLLALALTPVGCPARAGFCFGTHYQLDAFTFKRWYPLWPRWAVGGRAIPAPVRAINITRDGRYVVVAYGDGTIRWHLLSNGDEVLAFYVVPEPEGGEPRWVVWTPLGDYATSPGGEELIGWHVNHGGNRAPDFFDASYRRDRCNRPDVIARVLEAGHPRKARRVADAARRRSPA